MTATIITIGDELLIGQVIDTNSAWMAQELNHIGVTVSKRVAVGDEWEAIWTVLDSEMPKADIVLLTGGLGPTADDITKPLLCDYFGGKMVVNEAVLQHLHYLFEKVFSRPMIQRNARQAEVPDVCTVLHNANGTAPGMWFEKNGVILVSLPGVPFEMKGLMTNEVIPALQKRFELPVIHHRTLLTAGIGESYLAERIKEFESSLPPAIKLAYLPHYGMVRLRLSATGFDKDQITHEIDGEFNKLQAQLADVLVTNKDEPLEKVVADLLLAQQKTIGTAESCTGGHIAQLITAMPGASQYYKGSVVSYANEIKTNILHVAVSTLQNAGAVSEEIVIEMVKGALDVLKTDFVVATSGIMGPDGGTPEKPVGTVWVAVGNQKEIITQRFKFRFDRLRNIDLTAINALNLCRKFILDQSL
nr:CinA family nicotinamide mononucleotide deamidase-related protein [Flavihumibacter fluvii]